jgi:type I restriction enzyme S subunit
MAPWSSLDYENQGLSKLGLNKARVVDSNSVLMVCIGATIGKVGFTEREVTTNQQINSLTPLNGDCAQFLFYQMLTEDFQQKVLDASGQATLPIINKTKWSNLSLYLPPISEQKRIVAIADEAFEGIDRAIRNTEKNLSNARELFESYLNSIFTQKGDGWEEKKLGDIATFRNGLNFTKSSKGESINIVGVKDFQNHFWIQENQLESVTIDAELKEIDILHKGDILTVRSNGNKELIGRCVLAGDISEKTSHSGFTIRIRIEREDIYLQFIVHYLKSKQLRKQLTESGGGISISSLNQQGLSLIKLSFPTFAKQKAIVSDIEELATETQQLETIYRQKIAALKELKQSILQKAFTGELTADKWETNKEEKAA